MITISILIYASPVVFLIRPQANSPRNMCQLKLNHFIPVTSCSQLFIWHNNYLNFNKNEDSKEYKTEKPPAILQNSLKIGFG